VYDWRATPRDDIGVHAMGVGAATAPGPGCPSRAGARLVAGFAIALIFFLRMRIEDLAAKRKPASRAGRVRDRRCAVFAAPGHTQQCRDAFLTAAAACAPLFALWVVLDYRRALVSGHRSRAVNGCGSFRERRLPRGIAASAPTGADQAVTARLRDFDLEPLRRDFIEQGAFIYLRDFLAPETTAQLVAAVAALTASVNRNYLPATSRAAASAATPSIGWRRVLPISTARRP